MVGIEKLTEIAEVAGNLATNIIYLDSDRDGKVEFTEIFSAGQDILVSAWGLINDFDAEAIKAEVADLSVEEMKQLVVAFNKELELKSPEADAVVVKAMNSLLDLVELFNSIKGLINENK
jgi:hypothetical protein